jgi:hypothetical protein
MTTDTEPDDGLNPEEELVAPPWEPPLCSRCHGSGEEPGNRSLTRGQIEMLQQVRDIGVKIAEISFDRTPESYDQRRKFYNELRALKTDWQALGLTKPQIAGAAGLSRQGLHNILTHAGAV